MYWWPKDEKRSHARVIFIQLLIWTVIIQQGLNLSLNRWSNIRGPLEVIILITAIKVSYAHITCILNFRVLKQICYFSECPEGTEAHGAATACSTCTIVLGGHLTARGMLSRVFILLTLIRVYIVFPFVYFPLFGKGQHPMYLWIRPMYSGDKSFRYVYLTFLLKI